MRRGLSEALSEAGRGTATDSSAGEFGSNNLSTLFLRFFKYWQIENRTILQKMPQRKAPDRTTPLAIFAGPAAGFWCTCRESSAGMQRLGHSIALEMIPTLSLGRFFIWFI